MNVKSASVNPIDFLAHQCANKWLISSSPKTIGRHYADVIVRRVQTQQAISHLKTFDSLNIDPKEYNRLDIAASYPMGFGTAYGVLYDQGQKLGPDSKILVNGASTAVSNVQIAKKELKIGTVIGICNSKSFEYNKETGFDHLIAYEKGNVVEEVQKYLDNDLEGAKFNLIFDSVGTSQFFPTIDKLLKPMNEGSYFVTSAESILRELTASMIEKGTFIPSLDSRYDLEDFQKAIDRLSSNKAKGKVIVTVNTD